MTRLSTLSMETYRAWEATVPAALRGCGSLEEAAQRCIGMLYDQFWESVVLARLYAIVPFSKLPPLTGQFARNIAATWAKQELLAEDTKVMTLCGTRGDNMSWNSRRNSRNHIAIPLISSAVEEQLPMVARMIKELGVPMDWLGTSRSFAADTFGSLGGFFFVEDAATALDDAGRRIIPAQDFVKNYGVKTVFGTAGVYVLSRMIVTLIVFTRESLDRAVMRQMFMPLGNVFTNATAEIMRKGKLFT